MKKILSLMLILLMVFSLAACNKNGDTAEGNNGGTDQGGSNGGDQQGGDQGATAPDDEITILCIPSNEKVTNIIRDQLVKSGFNVNVNMQPDYSSWKALADNGNYDIAVTGWTTVTGNPDYAVRALIKSDGDSNIGFLNDPVVDEYVEKAASETAAEYMNTYAELERYIIEEHAYFLPLYRGIKTQGVNTDVLNLSTVRLSQARSMVWEKIEFNDTSRNATDPVFLAQAMSDLTSLDPIKGNDGSINQLNSNMYIRLVNLTDDDIVIPDGSLSLQFAIAETNESYYFVLRDDVNFAKVEDMKSVDTGVRVGGEDVVFSLQRARDRNSVPNHRTYSLHESMKEITLVTDLTELEETMSDSGKSIKEVLETGTAGEIAALTGDKSQVDNSSGTYQVIRVDTVRPFPQVLNYLAHQSAGIVSQQQIEAINTYDVETYDVTKDIAYGDQSAVTEGASYDNHLWTSGPYIMIKKNDYQADFMKNPGYMPGTEYHPKVTNFVMRFIADQDSQLSALRAGEIYVLYSVPEAKIGIVQETENLALQEIPSNAVTYATFNLERMSDENLRKAILYSIDQEAIISVFDNRVFRAYSTLAPFLDAGNVLNADPAKVQEYLDKVGK